MIIFVIGNITNYSLQTFYVMVKEFATNNQALLYEVDTNTTPVLIIAIIVIACYFVWKAYKSYKTE